MEEKLKIVNDHEGNYFIVFPDESKIKLHPEEINMIIDIISGAVNKRVNLIKKVNTKEEKPQVKKETRKKIRPKKDELLERYDFIAHLHLEGTKRSEITKQVSKKFGLCNKTAVSCVRHWLTKVGLHEKSKPFNKYLAEHNYKVEDYEKASEQFGMSVQKIKRTIFEVLTVLKPK